MLTCPLCGEQPATVDLYDDTYLVGKNTKVCERCLEIEWGKIEERRG